MYNEVKYIKYALSASVGLFVSRSVCCAWKFGVLFSQRAWQLKWNVYLALLLGSGMAWHGLAGTVLCRNPPMRTNLRLARRLTDSLLIHSSLSLVSFACATLRTVDQWTWVGFASLWWRRHRRWTILRTQFTVLSSLNVKQHKVIDGWMHKLLMATQTMRLCSKATSLTIGWPENGRRWRECQMLLIRRSCFVNCSCKWCAKIVVAATVRYNCPTYLDIMWNVKCL